ncbi:4,5-DOPA dioxygenase extradiol [Fluoribacter gormanii]|uniref:4,5-DOPA-extradiol-dioxygenase n=1 Tax=Fluoribacter gormanii TaxID=464 RepID=UPI001F5F347F|nr:4,5-DOPA dioxygenase extradiol [Fluoribacter gormanii]MCW8444820.1 4,5-DOPA dioxygenase extradiol [Fluoribacter gormanii]MCW8470028.1 4,5-DOPA dioxygenase extradiol [Fluoribacter gormanii]
MDMKDDLERSKRMPLIFIGHGCPMHAIQTNKFTLSLQALGNKIPQPTAIVCISAHWLTKGTWVTHMLNPRTIHDFYCFPKKLFNIAYPAPGSPETAERIRTIVTRTSIKLDDEQWGLDHGTWSVVRHIYPRADIPIVQLSIDIEQPEEFHYQIGQQLQLLREQNILIVSSGNLVHNLSKISWERKSTPYDWAVEFDEWFKEKLMARDFAALITHYRDTIAGKLSVPTPDHYYPLLYILGAAHDEDELVFIYEAIENSSISMRTFLFG